VTALRWVVGLLALVSLLIVLRGRNPKA